jgi:hypothetical protein
MSRTKADADRAAFEAETAVKAAEAAAAAVATIPKPPPPDPRQAPFFDLLAAAERTALARVLPRRNRWADLLAPDYDCSCGMWPWREESDARRFLQSLIRLPLMHSAPVMNPILGEVALWGNVVSCGAPARLSGGRCPQAA